MCPQGRQTGARLADAGAAAPDRRYLHGHGNFVADRQPIDRARPSSLDPDSPDRKWHHQPRTAGGGARWPPSKRQVLQANMIGLTLCVISEVGDLALSGDPEFRFVSGISL